MSRPLESRPAQDPGLWLSEKPVTAWVTGTSMTPYLDDGDRVELVLGSPGELNPGMLLAFRLEDGVIIHRLLAARRDRMLEKGDAQDRGAWRPWPDVVGRAVAAWRGDLREDLASPQALALGRRIARAERLRHRLHAAAARLPGALPGRILLRAARFWLARGGSARP